MRSSSPEWAISGRFVLKNAMIVGRTGLNIEIRRRRAAQWRRGSSAARVSSEGRSTTGCWWNTERPQRVAYPQNWRRVDCRQTHDASPHCRSHYAARNRWFARSIDCCHLSWPLGVRGWWATQLRPHSWRRSVSLVGVEKGHLLRATASSRRPTSLRIRDDGVFLIRHECWRGSSLHILVNELVLALLVKFGGRLCLRFELFCEA